MENLAGFFEGMTESLTKESPNYENILVIVNIDIKCKGLGSNNLSDFCDLFHLTSFTKTDTSATDLILANKPSSFKGTLMQI